jgi:hypothetical protein
MPATGRLPVPGFPAGSHRLGLRILPRSPPVIPDAQVARRALEEAEIGSVRPPELHPDPYAAHIQANGTERGAALVGTVGLRHGGLARLD